MPSYKNIIIDKLSSKLNENEYVDVNIKIAKENNKELTTDQKEALKRLNFDNKTKIQIAARVGFICSYPNCNQATLGPDGKDGFVILGEAAHIYGAVHGDSNKNPRPSPESISEDNLKSFENGIWLCRHHHKLIDSIWGENEHTPDDLKKYKKDAEERQKQELVEKNHEIAKRIFDSIPSFSSNNIDLSKLRTSEWLLILYSDYYSSDDRFIIIINEYIEWLTQNKITQRDAGIGSDYFGKAYFYDYNGIIDRLTGLISISVCEDGELYFKKHDNFYLLIDDLFKLDHNYFKEMLDELKVKY